MIADPSTADWSQVSGAVLLGGDTQDVPEMQRIARALPPACHVTMLIEAFCRIQVYRVSAPENVEVRWLIRDRDAFDVSPCAVHARGRRLAAAVYAWCAEWTCASGDDEQQSTVWLGARVPRQIVTMARVFVEGPTSRTPDARTQG